MENKDLQAALQKLQEEFCTLHFSPQDTAAAKEVIYSWPGPACEDIIICVHQSHGVQEPFHRHDFFYFNYTYRGEYDSISFRYDNRITIREGELYAGQPFAGHALCVHDNHETVIVGVLIRKETFFRSFLPLLSSDFQLLHFFLAPSTNRFSDEFLHFQIEDGCIIRQLLEMMVLEYACQKPDTQTLLKPLTLAFLLQVARQYAAARPQPDSPLPAERIVQYISEHFHSVTLKELAEHFSYHPNYISTLLRRKTGLSFSRILLEQRMKRAAVLLQGTSLSIEEIAEILGYRDSSNFYKAFHAYYGTSPRNYPQ